MTVETEPAPVLESVSTAESPSSNPGDFTADTRPSISQVKKRRGRPPKIVNGPAPNAIPAAQPCTIFSASYCGAVANLPFKITADVTKIKELELDADDKAFLGAPLADVLNELYPELMAKYPKWAVLLMGFAAIASKKAVEVSIIRKIKLNSEKKQTKEETPPPPESKRPQSFTNASEIPDAGGGITDVELRLKEKLQGL